MEELERWIVLNLNDVARERDPEVREAFGELDVLFLRRAVGEAGEGEIRQVVARWYGLLGTVDVSCGESTGR